jgi:hypothetical protein
MLNDAVVSATLRFSGDSLDPSEISRVVGLDPDYSHRKGDSLAGLSKRGKIIPHGPFRTGIWLYQLRLRGSAPLTAHLAPFAKRLASRRKQLARLRSKAIGCDLYCVVWFVGAKPEADLGPIMKRLGKLEVKVSIAYEPVVELPPAGTRTRLERNLRRILEQLLLRPAKGESERST